MHNRVHSPRGIEHQHVSQHTSEQEAIPQGISPEKCWESWQREALHEVPEWVHPLLEHDDGICQEVGDVDTLAGGRHSWVLLRHEPSNMTVEETFHCIVWSATVSEYRWWTRWSRAQ